MKSLGMCAAHCGMTENFLNITKASAIGSGDENITVTLQSLLSAPDETLYCIVSGNSGNGSILFRGRRAEPAFGKWLLC